jgi:hypothetical protein
VALALRSSVPARRWIASATSASKSALGGSLDWTTKARRSAGATIWA